MLASQINHQKLEQILHCLELLTVFQILEYHY